MTSQGPLLPSPVLTFLGAAGTVTGKLSASSVEFFTTCQRPVL